MHIKIAIFCLSLILVSGKQMTIDFGKEKAGQDWRIINDGVMGGLSEGRVSFGENGFAFKGEVSLENNGGFTSFKSPYKAFDLSDYERVRVRLKSKGQTLALTMDVDRRWYYPYFKHKLITTSDDWETLEIDLTEFKQYQIGRLTGDRFSAGYAPYVIRIGFTTDDKKAGPFEAEIDYIQFL